MGQVISHRKKKDYKAFTEEEAAAIVSNFEQTNCQIPAMFFSLLAYDWRLCFSMVDQEFSEETGYKILKGYGRWKVMSEFVKDTKLEVIRAIVLVCEERQQIIVAFRGTSTAFDSKEQKTISMNDWIHGSLHAHHTPWRNGLSKKYGTVHHGFLRHYQSIGLDLIMKLRSKCTKGYTVVFTGHSQGASLASLAALECAELCPKCFDRSKIFVITFGGPKLGNSLFVQHFEKLVPESHVTHYVTCYPSVVPFKDVVTTVPPNVMKFRQVSGKRFYVLANKKHLGVPTYSSEVVVPTGKWITNVPVWLHFREVYMFGVLENALSDHPFSAKYDRNKLNCQKQHEHVEHECSDKMKCYKSTVRRENQAREQYQQNTQLEDNYNQNSISRSHETTELSQ